MRTFDREVGRVLGAWPHVIMALAAIGAGLWGCWLALEMAASTAGITAAAISAATVLPLAYWPLHSAAIGEWLPAVIFYGGWSAAMLGCALYETTYCVSSVERAAVRKPR
jgi:hypothetical protein